MDHDPRESMIQQAVETRRADEVKIVQKVNAAHREAFRLKFPGQCDHILRLIAERLQNGLRKDIDAPLTNQEVADLSRALAAVYSVHKTLEIE
jgi:hypothetical protein